MKQEIHNELLKKYKSTCLECPYMKDGFTEESVSNCAGCEKFSKEEMSLLLNGYYDSRHTLADSAKLGLPDKILDRIFELYFEGTSKYAIVQKINEEFPRRKDGKKIPWVNWKKVHWVIEGKYIGKDAKERIGASRSRVEGKMNSPS